MNFSTEATNGSPKHSIARKRKRPRSHPPEPSFYLFNSIPLSPLALPGIKRFFVLLLSKMVGVIPALKFQEVNTIGQGYEGTHAKTLAIVYTIAYNWIVEFEWDDRKNQANFEKHGVWFEEAQTIWADTHAAEFFDPEHSSGSEDRFLRIGLSSRLNLLLVVFCERNEGEVIRVISARKATRKEKEQYEEGI